MNNSIAIPPGALNRPRTDRRCRRWRTLLVGVCGVLATAMAGNAGAVDPLEAGFQNPPESARPWTWWHWMNGNVSKAGITADLEAMKRVGIGGFFNFHVGQLPFDGSVKFLSPEWWDLMRFTAGEADRLGLQMGFHNCPGWSSSGGPWVKVEDSMQKLVWSELKLQGPGRPARPLARPAVDPKWNYYADIAVIALPESTNAVSVTQVLDLTGQMNAEGWLDWDAPAGNWVVFRFGHTTTGKENHPAPIGGAGFEVDKMRREAVAAHFRDYPARILANAGPARKAITTVEIDSYEAGKQDWTPGFRDEFKARRGYDPLALLPVLAGRVVGSSGDSGRFKHDWSRTIADLYADNYYGHFRKLVHEQPGLKFTVEPYDGPFDPLTVGSRGDVVMGEFWHQKPTIWGWNSLPKVASVAHTLGMPVVAAESFTGLPQLAQWRQDPYALKSTGDKAFCLGVNRFVLHTTAHQPWPDSIRPGMTMSWWGTHFGRTQTWWEQSTAWFQYVTRCQFLLQQGAYAGDLLFLDQPDFHPPKGYAGDAISQEVFLRDLEVKAGRLVLPHGADYRLLVLPPLQTMLPAVARKLESLAQGGAALLGTQPNQSPSLENQPAADAEVRQIADALWGQGKVMTGPDPAAALAGLGVQPDFAASASDLLWIHRRTPTAEIYFVSSQKEEAQIVECSFRVTGRLPELWDAATGEIREAGTYQMTNGLTRLPLKFDPSGSVFVVFRRATSATESASAPNGREFYPVQAVAGGWTVRFDSKWGGPAEVRFDQLEDWSRRPEQGIRYYSGTAAYENAFEVSPAAAGLPLWLDLGDVKNIAEVELNGMPLGILWKPPFRVELSKAVRQGANRLVVKVTNLWPNRLIGDEQEPEDLDWGPTKPWKAGNIKGNPGKPLQTLPDWLVKGQPRPSKERYTFTTWKFYEKDSPLLPSGLLGPVQLLAPQ